eukprot:CAMPEP_0171452934 /NCGR_PEP_ID=MMETSP0945-20130129/849_1 /TAXON_ID=109269 /ORGANISM="Vaucheria litorea, Strain CCMP2940" /LENGTH=114 /DNA_ID=CAMNT_0011977711 /DNA_START=45 /DNA_END=389 /DNA_ORIENTATION=+
MRFSKIAKPSSFLKQIRNKGDENIPVKNVWNDEYMGLRETSESRFKYDSATRTRMIWLMLIVPSIFYMINSNSQKIDGVGDIKTLKKITLAKNIEESAPADDADEEEESDENDE